MDLIGEMTCLLTGHDWVYRRKYRVCEYCGKIQRTP